jgi:hypothetical protein
MTRSTTSPFSKSLGTLSWAIFLGMSWTWCIGMFLPVILVSELGNLAWWVFAIPNVIGAAAMGWVLARPGSSERIVSDHRTACVAFSAVTLAFHVFFLCWLTSIGLMPAGFALIAVGGGIIFGSIGRRWTQIDRILAWLVLGVSLTVLGKGLSHPVFGVPAPSLDIPVSRWVPGLSVVCVFGFLLCPYLDLTFHKARQSTSPQAGRFAFGFGFGVVFLLMIVLTLLYAGDFARDRTPQDRFGSFGGAMLISWVALHIAVQTGFKFTAHLRALPGFRKGDLVIWALAAICAGLGIFAIRQQQWFHFPHLAIQMLSGDLVYRLFMSFYGLAFPAYVCICMIPRRGAAHSSPSRSQLGRFAIAVSIAVPMFWLGFIHQQFLWLIPAVGFVLLATWRLPVAAPDAPPAASHPPE